jgi:glycosyltransferase involved in cell wall biosynthesis
MSLHNILFIEAGYGKGGSSTALAYELEHINRNKFKPIVCFYHRGFKNDVHKIKDLGVDVIELDLRISSIRITEKNKLIKYLLSSCRIMKHDFHLACRIVYEIKKRHIDLVVLNNDLGLHIGGVIAANLACVPLLVRKAGYEQRRKVARILSKYIRGAIAISKATSEDLLRDNPGLVNIDIVYRGVPLETFDPSIDGSTMRSELQLPEGCITVTSISRIDHGKGHIEIVHAAKSVISMFENVVFLIAGDDVELEGEYLSKIKEEVQRYGIQEKFRFIGWQTDVRNLLAATDIYIHCPNHEWMEGLGISAIEAAAMAKPMIVSDNYGLKETVIDGQTGYIIGINNIQEISERIIELCQDKSLRTLLGNNARIFAEERFSSKNNTKKLEKIFKEYL